MLQHIFGTTVRISIFESLLIGIIIYIISLPFLVSKGVKKNIFTFSVIMYSSFLLFLTVPIVLAPYPENILQKIAWVFPEILWNPLHSIEGIHSISGFVRLIIGNFCLLMPIPIFALIKNKDFCWKVLLLISVNVSVGIETLQFIGNIVIGYSYRSVELLDVILNVSGSVVCFFVFKQIRKTFRSRSKMLK